MKPKEASTFAEFFLHSSSTFTRPVIPATNPCLIKSKLIYSMDWVWIYKQKITAVLFHFKNFSTHPVSDEVFTIAADFHDCLLLTLRTKRDPASCFRYHIARVLWRVGTQLFRVFVGLLNTVFSVIGNFLMQVLVTLLNFEVRIVLPRGVIDCFVKVIPPFMSVISTYHSLWRTDTGQDLNCVGKIFLQSCLCQFFCFLGVKNRILPAGRYPEFLEMKSGTTFPWKIVYTALLSNDFCWLVYERESYLMIMWHERCFPYIVNRKNRTIINNAYWRKYCTFIV